MASLTNGGSQMARECAHGVFDEQSEWDGSLDSSNGEMVKERTTGIIQLISEAIETVRTMRGDSSDSAEDAGNDHDIL
jgi:hypothetical protein